MAAPRVKPGPKPKKIPRFKSREEEAEFWDTHSPLDHGEWKEVKRLTVTRPLGYILGVRLDAKTIDLLSKAGRKKRDGRVDPRAYAAPRAPGRREVGRARSRGRWRGR